MCVIQITWTRCLNVLWGIIASVRQILLLDIQGHRVSVYFAHTSDMSGECGFCMPFMYVEIHVPPTCLESVVFACPLCM